MRPSKSSLCSLWIADLEEVRILRRIMKLFRLLVAALVLVVAPAMSGAERLPNFVLINCDDLGYGDLSCFGATTQRTPNIDLLAKGGTRFTSFYSTSGVCTPSRSSLMTGCYPRRTNMHYGDGTAWVLFPGYHKGLNPAEITVAEVLKTRGYATAIVGKWHLGDQPEFFPTEQGFDSWFGIPYSNDMGQLPRKSIGRPHTPLLRDDKVIESEPDQRYLTRRYTDEAVNFIKENRDQPFFLYVPHTFPHWPHYASEEFEGTSGYTVYGDCIQEVDWSTGQIMATLNALDLTDNTLVIFTSDNGGRIIEGEGSNGPLRGAKGTTWEGGQRVPMIAHWPGKIPTDKTSDTMMTTMDIMPTFAKLAGTEAPNDRRIDGHDVRNVLFGQSTETPYDAFFYYYTAHLQCVRSGDWKLRFKETGKRRTQTTLQPTLYNLRTDIGESTDVATANPDVVKQLLALAERARKDLGDGERAGANQRPAGRVENPKTLLPIVTK